MRLQTLLVLLMFVTFQAYSQKMNQNTYEANWKLVDNAMNKGLNATAGKEILSILKMAKQDNNPTQIIKAITRYRVSVKDRDEKSRLNDIQFFESELKVAKFPVQQILHSMLGNLYWTYYQENRYKIFNRTSIQGSNDSKLPSSNDIEIWTANDFYNMAYDHFNQSLSQAALSKNNPVKEISEIIEAGNNTEKLRPTLYDFLVHRAISYFRQEEIELTKPAYSFEINDAKAFAPGSIFINASFKTTDTTSRKFQVLKLYQELLSFHMNDTDPSALIDADIARIVYVNEKSVLQNRNELYVNALDDLIKRYPANEQSGLAMYYKAETFTQGGRNKGKRGYLNSTINDSAINYIEAKKILDQIIEKFPGSEGAYLARIKLQQIEVHSLSVQNEKVVLPDQPSLALINYRNIHTVYCKVVKMTVNEYKQLSYEYNENYKTLMNMKTFRSWTATLPERADFKNHSTEIKIESLPVGTYALIVSESSSFEKDRQAAFSFLHVSNLASITAEHTDGSGTDLYTMDRETGLPLENVTVKTWNHIYEYEQRKNVFKELKTYTSGKNGYVKLQQDGNQNSVAIELIKGDDNLFLNDYIYLNEYVKQYNDVTQTFFFTDRSIYRPGQLIYFKGIMVFSKGAKEKTHELLKDHKTKGRLLDANYQLVKELEFTTNDFGSFSGTFEAPQGLLTGQFHIEGEGGNSFFSVEEYKRPLFEVVIDTIRNSYRLNDIVRVNGTAKAYAGNMIDGAAVKYRVVREAHFPYYWRYARWGQPSSPSMEIVNGFATTKADGSFEIEFEAIPDEHIDRQTMPVFDYHIVADVTDINGETRSGSSDISVSYQSLVLQIESPEQVDMAEFDTLKISATNLGGIAVPANISVACKKIVTPSGTYRSRLWPKAEITSIPENEFRKDFPLDEYNNENDHLQWKTEKTVWTTNMSSPVEDRISVPKSNYEEGWYVIEATATDKDGEEVIEKKFIRLTNTSKPEALPNEHLLITEVNIKVEPGETAKIGVSSPYHSAGVFYIDSRNNSKAELIALEGTKFFEYRITEKDRGGFFINVLLVKNNRVYSKQSFINVPWSNKELHISVETFRDLMLPGSEQEWKLKITGSKKEKVAAELLATMYDASLDAFKPHTFPSLNLFRLQARSVNWNTLSNFSVEQGRQIYYTPPKPITPYIKTYSELNWWGLIYNGETFMYAGSYDDMKRGAPKEKSLGRESLLAANEVGIVSDEEKREDADKLAMDAVKPISESSPEKSVQIRSNFSETAFFFPHLQTDNNGNIILAFKAPDALTRWKMMTFAHSTDLSSGAQTSISITQKDLMIIPNTLRFLREGDKMVYSAKVTNLTEKNLEGNARLELFNAMTNEPIDVLFKNVNASKFVSIRNGESVAVNWEIEIPVGFTDPVLIKVIAQAGDMSDGEQRVVPVLLNSMLVTETLPLPVRTNSSKNFKFEKLIRSASSSTLRHHSLTVEYTANPAWYAIQSLPYLTDYPYECAEQTFNRYYANVLATHIANSSPKIKEIFSQWKDKDSAALLSNLQKNEELKSALLQETPWVLEAKNEAQQKQQVANLFNMNRMSRELERTLRELEIMQTPNGGFTWFKGMPDDRFITQYIITGIGRLMHLGVAEFGSEGRIFRVVERALPYLDARIKEDYQELLKNKINMKDYRPGYTQIQYLYMRSFFLNSEVSIENKTAFDYFKKQSTHEWTQQNKYMQGMLSLVLNRYGEKVSAMNIIESLRENAIHNEEMGMYWKEVGSSYWWYEAPVETQSIMIEAFKEVAMNEEETDELKIWLIKNKQTQNWKTTKATADACYALLLNGTYWLSSEPEVEIKMGNTMISSTEMQKEAGTGYFKTSIDKETINADMGVINVNVSSPKKEGSGVNSTTWGAVYWQYFESLDKITSSETPLSLKKQLFIERNSDRGPVLVPVSANEVLKVGDKVKVRIELRVDRAMEYVHMKDMRGACFEPVNVMSNYKYQGGLGYYEATKDAATNFFFNWLQKGTYVFEYGMFVTNKGDYSNGIASIQCMYAPEFSSHSEGIRVQVK